MCDCEEMLTRLTAAAVAKYNDKVPDAVLKLALSAQSCDYPKVAAEKNTITMAVPSFLGVDCYATKLNDYFQSNSLKVESDCFVQLTEQSVAHEFDKKPVYIGSFTFAEDCEIEKIVRRISGKTRHRYFERSQSAACHGRISAHAVCFYRPQPLQQV